MVIHHIWWGSGSGHKAIIVAYKMWGGSNWSASSDLQEIFTTLHKMQFQGTPNDFNYIPWDGSEWTATIDPGSKVFTHTRRGATSSHTDTILNYLTWDGSAWTMRLE